MTISNITDTDAVRALHESSGFDYQFPKDFSTPLFPVRRMATDASGRLVAAFALKVEAETYLWLDSSYGSPETRWQALQELNADLVQQARVIGFDQAHCVVPPEISKQFGKRLRQLGWDQARPWPLYTYQLR